LDLCGHINAGTTPREDSTLITAYTGLAFEGIFLTSEELGTYICSYPHISRARRREEEPRSEDAGRGRIGRI